MAIESLVLDASSDAGRARARFLRNLPVLEKSPSTMLGVVRQFMDSLKLFIQSKKMNDLRKTMGLATGSSSGALPGEEETPLETRLERAVQAGVVQPAYSRLLATVRKQCLKEDELLSSILSRLRVTVGADQSFYGIPLSAHNPSGWLGAVGELNDLDRVTLPADKIGALLRAAKSIYHTFNEDRIGKEKKKGKKEKMGQYFLSADDFFPSDAHKQANSKQQTVAV